MVKQIILYMLVKRCGVVSKTSVYQSNDSSLDFDCLPSPTLDKFTNFTLLRCSTACMSTLRVYNVTTNYLTYIYCYNKLPYFKVVCCNNVTTTYLTCIKCYNKLPYVYIYITLQQPTLRVRNVTTTYLT